MIDLSAIFQNEHYRFFVILGWVVIFVHIAYIALMNPLKRLAKKTKTELDDQIVKVISVPLYLFMMLTGIYFSLRSLSSLAPHMLWITRIFFSVLVMISAYCVSKIINTLIESRMKTKGELEKAPKLLEKIVFMLAYLVGIILIMDHFNISITPLLATLGVGGLALGLALQSTLSNFFAGINIISDKLIKVGDFVEFEGNSGFVEDIGWRSTKIKTIQNYYIIAPNSKIAESTITTFDMPENEVSILVECGVAYTSDLKKVERVTIEVAKGIQNTVEGAVRDFEPFIRFRNFGDSNIDFTVTLRAETITSRYVMKHEFIKALKARYDKEKIEISWPVRKVFKGN